MVNTGKCQCEYLLMWRQSIVETTVDSDYTNPR